MEVKPGYKQTEVGVIPEEWDEKPLNEGIKLLSGHHVLAQHCNTEGKGPPYITGPADFPDGSIKNSKFTEKPTTICRKEDILHTVKGSGAGTIVLADGEYCISRQLMAVRVTEWDTAYVYASLRRDASLFGAAATGLIPGLSRGDILNKRIPVPPLREQRAIAGALTDVDALIGALDSALAKKRNLKQAAMQQLLTGQKRLPGFHGEWEAKRLGDVGVFSKGRGIKKDEVVADGLPCVRYGEIYTHHNDHLKAFNSFITPETAKQSQRLQKGDLLFAGSGETAEEIGKCIAFLGDEEAYAGGDIVIFRPVGQDSKFLGFLMNHSSVASQKARMGQGDAVVHISARNLARLELHLPSLPEQTAIAEVLSDMDAELAALTQRRDKTRALKQGMMQELLTGRTRLV